MPSLQVKFQSRLHIWQESRVLLLSLRVIMLPNVTVFKRSESFLPGSLTFNIILSTLRIRLRHCRVAPGSGVDRPKQRINDAPCCSTATMTGTEQLHH